MGNRKLPFGYQMRMGEIVRNEPEAKAVQDIFLQYTLGASLKEIAEQMSKTGPTYDEGKSWNKNMIARILENPKYTGADSYPKLVDIKLFEAAAEKRQTKQRLPERTPAQKALKRVCSKPPAPEIEQLIMAAGTISFFGTRRVVVLPEIDPAAYSDKDLEELNSTLSSLENAVVVLGSVFELERSKLKTGKRAQKLIAQCKALGYTEELAKPKPFELKMMMIDRAKEQKTTLPDGAATALLERCGEDPFLLENEVDKLCALSGYQTVTAAMVAEMGTVSLEADVFEMIRMITAKNATGACKKLQTLLRLQQEPIAITAAMIGSYVDLYRVKLGAAKRKNYSTVFKDFGYKGSDYRLKRSAETASHYTLGQIENCMQVLLELDQSLKSQPTDDQILLETALCRLAMAGSGR